jgi:NADPH:quinone reductase
MNDAERAMKAVWIDSYGGPDVLTFGDRPDPVAGPGQILIKVESASVNWSDTVRRRNGAYPFPTPLPFVPGGEVAGMVAALGEGVDGPPVGTDVFALAGADGSSGYAQYVVANAHMVIPRPIGVSADEAAAIMVAGGTAMLVLRDAARLQRGESVLIEGAGGGVGSYAIQIARALGAGTIIGAASTPQRREAALAFGADKVVDYTVDGWSREVTTHFGGGADVVLETVGGATLNEAFASLGPFGRMVVYGQASGTPGHLTPAEQDALFYLPVVNQSVIGFNIGLYFGLRPHIAVGALTELIGLVASGTVKVQISERLALSEAQHAHQLLEDRRSIGKIILKPW